MIVIGTYNRSRRVTMKEKKNVKCGMMVPHTPHEWGIGNGLQCDGEGLR